MTTRRALLLTVLSAGLYGLAFPPIGAWGLAWIALAPFFVALRGRSLAGALGLGWLWGVLAAYALGVWFADSVSTYFLQPRWIGFALFLGVATTMVAPYTMLFAVLARGVLALRPPGSVIALGAAWAACELARGRLFTGSPVFIGNPWGLLGYSQAHVAPVVQIAAWTGIYGVSFAAACVSAGVAKALSAPRRARVALAAGLAPAVLCLVYGAAELSRAPELEEEQGAPILLVQGDVALGSQWRSELYGRHLETYLRLTLEGAREHRPEVVFWPESSMTFFLEEEASYRRAIARVLDAIDAELVAGGPRREPAREDSYTNSVWRITRAGELRARYDKRYLIPLAEYVPFREVDFIRRNFGRVRAFEHGREVAPLDTAVGRAGVVICNEVMLPEVVSQRVADGADYLLNPSNDTWLSHPQYVELQFAIAVVRAVEQRRSLVRVSTAGPSAVVDAWGRVRARTARGERATLPAHLVAHTKKTPYHRAGDLFGLACAALAVAGSILGARIGETSRYGGGWKSG